MKKKRTINKSQIAKLIAICEVILEENDAFTPEDKETRDSLKTFVGEIKQIINDD